MRLLRVALIKKAHQETLAQIEKQIARIDQELAKLIKQDPEIFQKANNLDSIPGYGMLLAAHLWTAPLQLVSVNFSGVVRTQS